MTERHPAQDYLDEIRRNQKGGRTPAAEDATITPVQQGRISETILFLERLADELDNWATASKSGGWSTHQVAANERAANDCRRQASRLRFAMIR